MRQFLGIGEEGVTTLAGNEPMWWTDLVVPHWHYAREKDDLKMMRGWDMRRVKARVRG